MNRTRWAVISAVAAGLAVLIGVALGWNGSRTTGPSSTRDRQAFAFDAAYADPDPMMLVVRYGDSSSCPSQAVRPTVLQKPDRVVVTLTRAPMPADQPCTSDYGAKLVRLPLTSPLAGRPVIDGSRSKSVPISTGTPPFG